MEETVSVLICECWLWEDAMDMTDWARLLLAASSGDEMVEDSGVPVHEDWSMAPDEDSVRFSLSGVMPHSSSSRAGDFLLETLGSDSVHDFSSSSSGRMEEFWDTDPGGAPEALLSADRVLFRVRGL